SSSSQPEKESQWLVDPVQTVIHLHSYISITTKNIPVYIHSFGILYQKTKTNKVNKTHHTSLGILPLPRHHP
ncbi:MAG: hypothetical protein VX367_00290, partial [SAR324 cluster bacterium]|nr:hypothetical protein [SAR324 cluster bacterium]